MRAPRICRHRGMYAVEWYEDWKRRRHTLGTNDAEHAKVMFKQWDQPGRISPRRALRGKYTVYFAQCNGSDGPIKIGIARSVPERLRGLQQSNPYPIAALGVMDGGRELEADLHSRFAATRITGEWFSCSHDLVAFIAVNAVPLESVLTPWGMIMFRTHSSPSGQDVTL